MTSATLILWPGLFFIAWLVVWIVFVIGGLVAWIWALIDSCQRPEWEYGYAGSNKTMWVVLIAVLGGIGALIYFFAVRSKLQAVRAAYAQGTLRVDPWPQWAPPGGYCGSCGAALAYGSRFCTHCGSACSQSRA